MVLYVYIIFYVFFVSANQKKKMQQKKMYSPTSLRTLCIVQLYQIAGKECNTRMRDLFARVPTLILKSFLSYAHFRFIRNFGFTEHDIFCMAEEIYDQRQFTLPPNHYEKSQYCIEDIIVKCSYMSSEEVINYLQNVPNSVLSTLRHAYEREGFSEIIRRILNSRYRNNANI